MSEETRKRLEEAKEEWYKAHIKKYNAYIVWEEADKAHKEDEAKR